MGATLLDTMSENQHSAVWGSLPRRMKVLYISTRQRTGGWLAEAFAADSAAQIVLEEAVGTVAGLARLRDEAFDVVLVGHEPGELDALDLIEGCRAAGSDDPIIVLGIQSEQEMTVLCYEVGADGYVCVHTTTTRNLIWVAARAIERHQLLRDNQRLFLAKQAQLQRERDEADHLLRQQRALLGDLETFRDDGFSQSPALPADPLLPAELVHHYRELLRAYVIMGSGNLAVELKRLGKLLVAAGLTPAQTMQLHLHVLEELMHGLGERSTRHVMTRADLLVMELMMHLAEGYRQRYQEQVRPPVQLLLQGF